jgi:uncharacterized protein with PQ loop repeat
MGEIDVLEIFGLLGLIPTYAMFTLPLADIAKAFRDPQPMPNPKQMDTMVGMFINCVLWLTYGFIESTTAVILSNVVGLAVSLIGMSVYRCRTRDEHRSRQNAAVAGAFVLASLMLYFELRVVAAESVSPVAGALAVLGSLILFVSGLSLTWQAWQEKDSSCISLKPVLGMLVSSVWWLVYGVAKGDSYITGANGFGTITTTLTLFVYYKFRR